MQLVSLLFHDVFESDPQESGFNSPAADRYKLTAPEFDEQLAGLKEINNVRLTFDDGGVSFYTVVADRLEARGLYAYCFVTTDFIGSPGFLDAAQIRDLDARGHVIGTHSATHPARFSALSSEDMLREWLVSRRRLEDVLGHAVSTASVPGGYFSREVGETAARAGLFLLFNSEPVRLAREIDGCAIAGRFTIRAGAPADLAGRLVQGAPWARSKEWAVWNAKGLVKPLLGSSYPRVADWVNGGAR
ncbi:MAG TPA: polysaccharide deacetylase family protein [Vicinamibacterales bacterium]|nr:polysaccharide deacetylase family protein [Vicinamibacterales bacterium]